MSNIRRINVLGVGVHDVNLDQSLGEIESAIAAGNKGYVCATGVHGVMEAQKDAQLKSIFNRSLVTTPDGRPTVWVGRLQGSRTMDQLTGPNLMLSVCELSAKLGYTNFFYGGNTGVADELKQNLCRRFPGLKVVGTYTPPFRKLNSAEEAELISTVARLKPDIFWVGLSTPKQERFMAEYIHRLDTTLMMGVGAAFDMHTGRIQDSPDWIKRAGLQWAHRLAQEPRRLWKRYLINNPRFIFKIAFQLLGLTKYELI